VCSIAPSAFDIMPLVPGSGLEQDGSSGNLRVLRVVRTTRLLKLARLVRSSRLVMRWRTRVSIHMSTLAAVSIAFYLLVATHWMACMPTCGPDPRTNRLARAGRFSRVRARHRRRPPRPADHL
jgi:hypothetical protein